MIALLLALAAGNITLLPLILDTLPAPVASSVWTKRDPSSEFQMPKVYAVAKASGEIIIYTQKHGEINLDTLLSRIDSLLDRKMRDTTRRRKPEGAGE